MNKRSIVFIVAALVLVAGIAFAVNHSSNNSVREGASDNSGAENSPYPYTDNVTPGRSDLDKNPNISEENSSSAIYTLAEVAVHNNASSCWTIVRSNVYDLTNWIKQHPGGSQAILGLCGRDGTATFEGQHAGSENPEKALASFKIGTYKN